MTLILARAPQENFYAICYISYIVNVPTIRGTATPTFADDTAIPASYDNHGKASIKTDLVKIVDNRNKRKLIDTKQIQ